MLISMTVRNIALIESLTIEFHRGMHVLSGETGAVACSRAGWQGMRERSA